LPEAKRKLKNIQPEEISLVDFPANMIPFFFIKQDERLEKAEALSLAIGSDGTAAGTEIQVNGKKIKDLKEFSFSYWVPDTPTAEVSETMGDQLAPMITATWAVKGDKAGFRHIYGISKAEIDEARKLSGELNDAEEMKKASALLETYREDLPSDLAGAMQFLISKARGQGQGVGGPRQGDGGADKCVCPDCGAEYPHDRGTPCNEQTCPECGATLVGKAKGGPVPPHTSPKAPEDMAWSKPKDSELKDSHYAWIDPEYASGESEDKSKRKLPHHLPDGRVVWRGVAAAAQRLDGTDIPEGDMAGVRKHLERHYTQFDKTPPWKVEKGDEEIDTTEVSKARVKMLKELEDSLGAASKIIRDLAESFKPVQKDEEGDTAGDAADASEGTEDKTEDAASAGDKDGTTAVAEQGTQAGDAKDGDAKAEGAEEASGGAGEDKTEASASLYTPEFAETIASTVGTAVSESVGRLLGTNDKEGNSE